MESLFKDSLWQAEAEDQAEELRQILSYNDSTGKLYVATDNGNVRCTEIRQCLLTEPVENAVPVSVTTYRPSTSMDITITTFEVNKLGTHAVLAGSTLTDPEISAIYIMDFTSRWAEAWVDGDEELANSNIWVAQTIRLDSSKFETHPGLVVRQASWHPDSDSHVAVLTSDCTLRLYNIRSPDLPEQVFELNASKGRVGISLDEGQDSDVRALVDDKFLPVSFHFGVGELWDRFAIYFLFAGGDTGVLCPVAPFGARYPSTTIDALKEGCNIEPSTTDLHVGLTREWIDRAFQLRVLHRSGTKENEDTPTKSRNMQAIYECVPHVLEEHCPMLVLPLLVVSNKSQAQGHPDLKEGLIAWRVAGALTLVAIASVNGVVDVYVMLDEPKPLWVWCPPQCIVIDEELQSTRSQVVVNGLNRQLFEPSSLSPTLLLIDELDMSSESTRQMSREVDVPGQTAGSRRVVLHVNKSSRDELFCIFPRLGVYSATLPWISLLAALPLAQEDQRNALASGAESGIPDSLPAPRLRQVMGYGESVASAVTVGDALCGSALVILTCDGVGRLFSESGCSSLPNGGLRRQGELSTEDQENDELSFIEEDIKKRLDRVYGSIMKGGTTGNVLDSKSMAESSTLSLATVKLLADAVARLRFGPIEHAHHAHHDLAERLNQLAVELEEQLTRIEQVSDKVYRVKERQLQLHAEIERRQWVMKNVSRRAQLLAELYWALPRPRSAAETAFQKEELPSLEDVAAKLEREISSLSARAAVLLNNIPKDQQSSVGSGTWSTPTSSLTPQQLGRWREVMLEHDRAIREVKNKLQEVGDLVVMIASSSVE